MWAHRGQGGFTLIESVISMVLVALVILALATGLLVAVRSSRASAEVQRIDSAVASFSESLKTAPYPVVAAGCPSLGAFQSAWNGYPEKWGDSGVTTQITAVEHWNPATRAFSASCPGPAPGTNPQVQRLAIRVDIAGRTRNAQVVVSKP